MDAERDSRVPTANVLRDVRELVDEVVPFVRIPRAAKSQERSTKTATVPHSTLMMSFCTRGRRPTWGELGQSVPRTGAETISVHCLPQYDASRKERNSIPFQTVTSLNRHAPKSGATSDPALRVRPIIQRRHRDRDDLAIAKSVHGSPVSHEFPAPSTDPGPKTVRRSQ